MPEGESKEGPSPKEIGRDESRVLSDAELIKEGARYVEDKEGGKTLMVTAEQADEISGGMLKETLDGLWDMAERGSGKYLPEEAYSALDKVDPKKAYFVERDRIEKVLIGEAVHPGEGYRVIIWSPATKTVEDMRVRFGVQTEGGKRGKINRGLRIDTHHYWKTGKGEWKVSHSDYDIPSDTLNQLLE